MSKEVSRDYGGEGLLLRIKDGEQRLGVGVFPVCPWDDGSPKLIELGWRPHVRLGVLVA